MMVSKIIEHPDMRVLQLASSSQVAYCGIAVHAGSRHEEPQQQGLAHFCEHLAFKGTERRSATQIINAIEGLGGELNAFTNKEDTVFYCAIEQRHLRRALDVLQDIVFNSQYPEQEVEKEREVVCDEIESYEDSPAELIFDDFENILFEGHPLGHNILGTIEQVRSYTNADALRFKQQWYRPENCVMFISQKTLQPHPQPLQTLPKPLPIREGSKYSQDGKTIKSITEEVSSPLPIREGLGERLFIRDRGTHQAHVMVGTRAYAAGDERRWALYLLNNILGGPALNSRLSMALRERNALVYTVDSSMVSYSDTGLWSIYFGCDPDDTKRCLRLVRKELDRLMDKPLSESQLRAAKQQLQGQLAIAAENREQTILDCARTYLHTGKVRTVSDVMQHIATLTAHDLQRCAQELFSAEQLTTLIYQ